MPTWIETVIVVIVVNLPEHRQKLQCSRLGVVHKTGKELLIVCLQIACTIEEKKPLKPMKTSHQHKNQSNEEDILYFISAINFCFQM